MNHSLVVACALPLISVGLLVSPAAAEPCPEEPLLKNYEGAGQTVCPCFAPGERAGVVLNAPAAHYPIEILRIGIGWASTAGGAPQSIEEAIRIYPAGLPNPGTPIFSLDGPVLTDGFINEFDVEPLGPVIVNGGPFTVALEFLNESAGDPFAPSVVHDGNGCHTGKNVVYAIPGGWFDACPLGVSGDWIFYAVYRRVNCGAGGVEQDELIAANVGSFLATPRPNPFRDRAEIEFFLAEQGRFDVSIYDIAGRRVVDLANGESEAGIHRVDWKGIGSDGGQVAPGVYFVVLETGGIRASRSLIYTR